MHWYRIESGTSPGCRLLSEFSQQHPASINWSCSKISGKHRKYGNLGGTLVICLVVTGTCFTFPYIGNVVIPIDFHIFQRGRLNHQPVIVPLYQPSSPLKSIWLDLWGDLVFPAKLVDRGLVVSWTVGWSKRVFIHHIITDTTLVFSSQACHFQGTNAVQIPKIGEHHAFRFQFSL